MTHRLDFLGKSIYFKGFGTYHANLITGLFGRGLTPCSLPDGVRPIECHELDKGLAAAQDAFMNRFADRSTTYEVCEECGEMIPDAEGGMLCRHHDESCSLYDADVE